MCAWIGEAVSERPILFSAPMVRAYRREVDPKTQTRRTRGLDKINAEPDVWELLYSGGINNAWWTFARRDNPEVVEKIRCPYAVAGDRLWVRESGKLSEDGRIFICSATPGECRLRTPGDYHPAAHAYKSVPSIHMPRWASRDTLEVVSVRPERLQHITAADAVAEGIEPVECVGGLRYRDYEEPARGTEPVPSFRSLWDSINGKKLPWSKNPWVWRIQFRRITT